MSVATGGNGGRTLAGSERRHGRNVDNLMGQMLTIHAGPVRGILPLPDSLTQADADAKKFIFLITRRGHGHLRLGSAARTQRNP